ncbi:DUF551 domain-containing protein [Enterobacter hormaechei]|uniref:DUF551 domain-containing protein n=1 Tax=Enterobacter hormaechei TaxID=158836 RepID=UPI001EE10CD5|nr:DUF551 domain-containing protein [Enterobacter hormaechei]
MSELTKEWLLKTIAELEEERDAMPGVVNEDAAMALAAMKLALASLEAEPGVNHQPVAWQYKEYVYVSGLGYLWREKLDCEFPGAECETLKDVVPLYKAPPAPVAVPDAIHSQGEKSASDDYYALGWNARRAAMLKHSEPFIVTSDHRMMEMPQVEAINAVTAILQGAEPVTTAYKLPDGWVACSERMPEESGRYWCYVEEQNDLGKSHYQWNCSWNGDRWWVESENGGRVTHWMPLPAAPQQEVSHALAKGMERYGDAMQELAKREVK